MAELFVLVLEIHVGEGVSAPLKPMARGSCLVISTRANTLETRSSAERQGRLQQLISQDLADDISADV